MKEHIYQMAARRAGFGGEMIPTVRGRSGSGGTMSSCGEDGCQPGGRPPRRRSWTEHDGWPPVWVCTGGRWQEAWPWAREDWPDGTVVYEVGLVPPGAERRDELQRGRYVYGPQSVQLREYGIRANGSQA
jgi:hypothetical protein